MRTLARMSGHRIRILRIVALIEGVSFLVLLGIGMPLKYLADIPAAVRITGWAHGVLFLAFCAILALVFFRDRWPMPRTALVFVAALVPFGPFAIDGRMRRYERGG